MASKPTTHNLVAYVPIHNASGYNRDLLPLVKSAAGSRLSSGGHTSRDDASD